MRYRLIDEAITSVSHPYPNLQDLIDKVNEYLETLGDDKTVAKRTIQKDLQDMRFSDELGYYAPIEYNQLHRGYYYDEEDFSISKLPLKGEERNILEFTANLLARYQDVPMFSSFKQITQRIFDALNIHSAIESDETFTHSIQFDQTPTVAGNNWLAPITEAIKKYRKLALRYQPFGVEVAKERVVHPYLLKEYKNRWYLIGISEQANEIRTYALDRITALSITEDVFLPSDSFDKKKYFEHSFGIYNLKNEEPSTVVLRFDISQAGYLKTQPVHSSQKIVEESATHIIIELKVYLSEDLKMFIMSHLPKVQVLEPAELRDEILGRVQKSILEVGNQKSV
ncbi:MAG: WYL domain-containing protein [Bacteroidetes bacterium]|nr:WYL domain-containing protein [Bacteroidota bacterium]